MAVSWIDGAPAVPHDRGVSMRDQLPGLLHRLERSTPAPVRRVLKRFFPSLVVGTHEFVLAAAPAEPTEATIADGPLRGRRFVCRLRYEADYIFGTHEPCVTAWLTTHVKPSSLFFDIGAHAGYTALIAAAIVGTGGQVVAFEPNVRNRELIARNLRVNQDLAAQVRIEPYAITDTCGTEAFGGDETTGHLAESGSLVATTSVDAYVAETGCVPSVIKIDIEGGETRAFDGMVKTLNASHLTLIVEIHDEPAHARFARVVGDYRYTVSTDGASGTSPGLEPWTGRRMLCLAY